MASKDCWFLCFVMYLSSFYTSCAGKKPEGYLQTKADKWTLDGEQHVFQFYDRESADFLCHRTTNDGLVVLSYYKESTNTTSWAESGGSGAVSARLVLRASDHGAVIKCGVFMIIGGDHAFVQLNLTLGNNVISNTWVVVFSVVGALLLAGLGLCIWTGYRDCHRKQSSLNTVTFVDRNSIENLDPRVTDDADPAGAAQTDAVLHHAALHDAVLHHAALHNADPAAAPHTDAALHHAALHDAALAADDTVKC